MRPSIFLAAFSSFPVLGDIINRQFPHILIPLDSAQPDNPQGTKKTGLIAYNVQSCPSCRLTAAKTIESSRIAYTEVSFDVPNNAAAVCRIDFFINTDPEKNAPRLLTGEAPYEFYVMHLRSVIDQHRDTFKTHPLPHGHVATVSLQHDGSVNVDGGRIECPKGDVAQFMLMPATTDRAFSYEWFELDYSAAAGGPHGIVLDMYT